MKVVKWLDDHLEETFLVILLILISCVSLLQVIIRKVTVYPALTWAEELCLIPLDLERLHLSSLYIKEESTMLRVGVLMDLLPNALHKIVNIVVDAVNTACMGLLGYWSFFVVRDIMASGETSPAMVWPMWFVYIFMLIGFVLGTIRGVQQIVLHIMHFGERELSTTEQTMLDAQEEAAAGKRNEGGE